MKSFRISISPSRRVATRYINDVRRAIQKAYAEEHQLSGLTQSEIARSIGVHRSVINRQLRGQKDLTLGRVGEFAYALGREPFFELRIPEEHAGTNVLMQDFTPNATTQSSGIDTEFKSHDTPQPEIHTS